MTPVPGTGTATLPFFQDQEGDTDAFTTPPHGVLVEVTNFQGGSQCAGCSTPPTAKNLDYKPATPQPDTVALDPAGCSHAYL